MRGDLEAVCAAVADPDASYGDVAGRLGAWHADSAAPPMLHVEPFAAWLEAVTVAGRADGRLSYARLEPRPEAGLTVGDLQGLAGTDGVAVPRFSPGRTLLFTAAGCELLAEVAPDDSVRALTVRPIRD